MEDARQIDELEVARRVLRNEAEFLAALAEAPLADPKRTVSTYESGVTREDIYGVANLVRWVLYHDVPSGVYLYLGLGDIWNRVIVEVGSGTDPYGRHPSAKREVNVD